MSASLVEIIEKWPELPESPKGWTDQMATHFNYGGKGGAAVYTVFDPDKLVMPFTGGYDTRKETKGDGFRLDGSKFMTWAELRVAWVQFVKDNAPS